MLNFQHNVKKRHSGVKSKNTYHSFTFFSVYPWKKRTIFTSIYLFCWFSLLTVASSSTVDQKCQGRKKQSEKAFQASTVAKEMLFVTHLERSRNICTKFGLNNVFSITEKFCSGSKDKVQLTIVASTCKTIPSLLHALSHFGEANEAGTDNPSFLLEKAERSQQANGNLQLLIISEITCT